MNKRLLTYMGVEASISFVANALINGVIAYFLHRKSGYVAVDWLSLAIDIVITSLFIGAFNASSAASSLRKNKAANILTSKSKITAFMQQNFKKPIRFGILAGICFMPIYFALSLSLFSLLGVVEISLWDYVIYKSAYTGLLGASIVILSLYSGMYKVST